MVHLEAVAFLICINSVFCEIQLSVKQPIKPEVNQVEIEDDQTEDSVPKIPSKQASQQGTIFGVATQHLLHLAADRRVYLMLILHLRVSSSDSSEVERLASILGDPRSIPPISKNIFVGN